MKAQNNNSTMLQECKDENPNHQFVELNTGGIAVWNPSRKSWMEHLDRYGNLRMINVMELNPIFYPELIIGRMEFQGYKFIDGRFWKPCDTSNPAGMTIDQALWWLNHLGLMSEVSA